MVKVLSGLQQMLNGCNSTATWSLQEIQSAAGQKEIPPYLNDKTELGMNESRSRKDGGLGHTRGPKDIYNLASGWMDFGLLNFYWWNL